MLGQRSSSCTALPLLCLLLFSTGKNQSVAAFFVAFLPAVSDAPVRLPSKVLRHVFERPSDIMQNIRKFYVTETLKQIYKIVGSLDFVGNPTMLVSSFVSGVKDLVVAPSMAFWKSPTDPSRVGLSVVQGAISLMSHSASGFFGALAKLASRAGQSVAIVSLDRDFRVWHRNKVVLEAANLNRDWKRRGVQKVEQILSRPVADIILGITGGVSGLVVLPVKGYQQHGSVGVIQGIAVGGIGLIAKPLVGILDAFTHFTSSIHDIAKSVNVLDKRHQPAIRLRMPYIFGVQSILAPYDPVLARAKNLLKNFPMSKPLSTAAERMVHTEVLPSTGVETYVIVTTMRIILLKVKKEGTGILSASRCWQIIFSTQSSISSQVVDHGHTGVAMTLLLQKQDPERSSPAVGIESLEEAAAAAAAVLSDASMFAPESQAGEVSSPSQQYLQDAATDSSNYGHGMQRDEEGGLHEWYTIVAEYQYRRQLSRLHNSISCVQGNIDAIIHDPSFTNSPRSSEGYTSFGMFHFEAKNTSGDNEKDVEIDNLVENCPWVSEDLFEASRGMNAEEQTLFLANLHERWTFPDELNASHSRLWLLDAGADESFVLPSKIATGSIDNLNLSSDTSLIPAHELADHNQPAFDDVFDENSATETETSKTFVSALQMSSLLLDTSENSTSDSRPDIESTHATTVKEQVLSPLDYTLSTVSAQPCTLPEKGTPTGLDQLIIHRPTTDHLTNATTHDSQENRFVRIERLMERLLIFSAEQALAQSHQPQHR
jgi:Vacuolar-sorting-associated 13 protein C-terminal